jgi:hypothetical protein
MIRENKVEKLMSGTSIPRGKLPSRRASKANCVAVPAAEVALLS